MLVILIQIGYIGVVIAEIVNVVLTFIYFTKNIEFFETNDNFIRLDVFIISIILFPILRSFIELNNISNFTIMKSSNIISSILILWSFFCSYTLFGHK